MVGWSEALEGRVTRAIRFYKNNEYTDVVEQIKNGTYVKPVEEESSFEKEGEKVIFELPIVFMQSKNLPAIYLNTESGSLDYIHESKENREAAFMEIVDASGRVVFRNDIEALKGHGNTTWKDEEKKPYMLKLQREESLLGMDSGRKWILLANYFDGSYIRNSIGLELARMAGMPYVSQSRYVDLYINNEKTQ